jgi:hypothetical protein
MVRALRAFLEFCYIARQDVITENDVEELENALSRFHNYRQIFITSGVCEKGISLPRQHAMVHYPALIRLFGAPNGLCSSITESKHITAVKVPWRRSNRNQPLGQMLMTNQRSDKLAAARIDFTERGMLEGDLLDNVLEELRKRYCTCLFSLPDQMHQGSSIELLILLKLVTNLEMAITNVFCLQELQVPVIQ